MPDRLMEQKLLGDVLMIGIVGRLDVSAMEQLAESIVRWGPVDGRGFGALYVDLSEAAPAQMAPGALADVWHAKMPRCPTAVIRGAVEAGYCRQLALRLASMPNAPIAMDAFDADDRFAALEWCQARAITYRSELARRL